MKKSISLLLSVILVVAMTSFSFADVEVSRGIYDDNELDVFDENQFEITNLELFSELQGNGPKPSMYALRANLLRVASGGRIRGYTMSADFLEHSTIDNASDLYFYDGSSESDKIKNSNEYEIILENVKRNLRSTYGNVYKITRESIVLNSTRDLHLALNKVDYSVYAEKISYNKWEIFITVHDTYNFEPARWKDYAGLNRALVIFLNNYGHMCQNEGAVIPYDIYITMNSQITI